VHDSYAEIKVIIPMKNAFAPLPQDTGCRGQKRTLALYEAKDCFVTNPAPATDDAGSCFSSDGYFRLLV